MLHTQLLITLQDDPHIDFTDLIPACTKQPVSWVGRQDLGKHTVIEAL